MSSYTCPKNGCASDDPDWCSECGANMHPDAPVSAPTPTAGVATAAPVLCPNCGTPRENNGRFCGVCRYNFETGQAYAPPAAAPATSAPAEPVAMAAPAAAEPVSAPSAEKPPASVPATDLTAILAGGGMPKTPWAVLIDFDPTVDPTSSPDISRPRPRLTFPLDLSEILIGRAGAKGHPDIPIEDEGVSSRHAKIIFSADGDPFLLELGSTNGTLVNGVAAKAGLPAPLKSGDRIVMGRWTRITIKSK
jgi:hypothetical protein